MFFFDEEDWEHVATIALRNRMRKRESVSVTYISALARRLKSSRDRAPHGKLFPAAISAE